MKRRTFFQSALVGAGGAIGFTHRADATPSEMKITRIRVYNPSDTSGRSGGFNQSSIVVTVETDAGITGIGEGGSKDLIEDIAGAIIGQDPFRTEWLWQRMYRGTFYPPGREKSHAVGALDNALWDIKGKVLDAPLYQLLGGRSRDYVESYTGSFKNPRTAIDEGYRACRIDGGRPDDGATYNSRRMVDKAFELCVALSEGVKPDGDWAIDFHTRFDMADAIRLCNLIEPLNPLFVEDPIRSLVDPALFGQLRSHVNVPLAAGEQFGDKWDGTQPLVEQNLIDYARATIPNVGGITEYMKLAALCETHYVGLIPHFTGPISTAVVIHALTVFSGPVLNEAPYARVPGYLPEYYTFRKGKFYPNDRPGIGVVVDTSQLNLISEITEPSNIRGYLRPDGSYTDW